jgi:hypothetical protein
MNYDLAIMALEGIARAPLAIRSNGNDGVVIEGSPATMKELARLLLLLGGSAPGETFELRSPVHARDGSPALTLRVV